MGLQDYPHDRPMTTEKATRPEGSGTGGPQPVGRQIAPQRMADGRRLLALGFGKPLVAKLIGRAEAHGTSVEEELLASGAVEEQLYFEALARTLGLPFLDSIDAGTVHDLPGLDAQLLEPQLLRLHFATRPPVTVIVPSLARLEAMREAVHRLPALSRVLAVAAPSTVRAATWEAGRLRRLRVATDALFQTMPLYSARITFWGSQGFQLGVLISVAIGFAALEPMAALIGAHLLLSLVYLAHCCLRLFAWLKARRMHPAPEPVEETGPLPVYSVLVPLYKEAAVAAQLVGALGRLDWPRARLDIKLICEEDDFATIAALEALPRSSAFEIVRVPAGQPRTKPKALAYALAGVRGTFVTVYDAEDRPHPAQLRAAWREFQRGGERLACLQAPLVISNAGTNWISSLFALEYAALFRGLLPLLADARLPLPLGGTSNHFRTSCLRAVGGWDPYNVTEDADLGIRLDRCGYKTGTIAPQTLEDAPLEVGVWVGQRTRWFKGWLQTWLVMMREPRRLCREMGLRAFTVSHLMIVGMLLSALGHPLLFAFLGVLTFQIVTGSGSDSSVAQALLVLDIANLVGSYASFLLLGLARMTDVERRSIGWRILFLPAYWILQSVAAWRAVAQLRTKPFEWTKTEHRPVTSASTSGE